MSVCFCAFDDFSIKLKVNFVCGVRYRVTTFSVVLFLCRSFGVLGKDSTTETQPRPLGFFEIRPGIAPASLERDSSALVSLCWDYVYALPCLA